jgi:hypothetical protein
MELEEEAAKYWLKLNETQRAYANARLKGMNSVESYKAAGLDPETVNDDAYAGHPKVTNYIHLAARAATRLALVSRTDVLNGLFDAVEAAGSSTELTAAWREIGRIVGAYEPQRVEVGITVHDLDRQRLATMSTKELITLTKSGGVFEIEAENDPVSAEFEALTAALEEPVPRV